MVNALLGSIERNILPFAVSSRTEGDFDEDIEKAAIFCFSELNREKGGGFLRKQSGEKLVFVSKVFYPFWLVPFRELTFLLDGLNGASHIIPYSVLPDLKAFKSQLNGKPMEHQVHLNFLADNQNYFEISNGEHNLTIEGLLNDGEFTTEFIEYLKEAKLATMPVTDAVFISPALDKKGVVEMLKKVKTKRLQFTKDVTDLNEIIKLLNNGSQESQSALLEEIKVTQKKFSVKIQRVKAIVDGRISKINKQYLGKVKEISDRYEQLITALQTEVVKFEKNKRLLDSEIERAEAEIKTAAVNKDDSTEAKWKKKRNELKDKRPEITSKLKELERKSLDLEDSRKHELFQLKQSNNSEVTEASRDLFELEALRDAEVKILQNQIEKIEELTASIITKVDQLAKNREQVIMEFDSLPIRQNRQDHMLIYMPFYLACYQAKAKKRYIYVPPAIVSDGGLGTRLKSLGKTKITQFFQTRYKKTELILNNFIRLLDEDIVFNREVSEACLKTNTLQVKKQQELIKTGLDKLKEESWLSSREFEEFNQALSESL